MKERFTVLNPNIHNVDRQQIKQRVSKEQSKSLV